jgi:hypothetical protein
METLRPISIPYGILLLLLLLFNQLQAAIGF